MIQEFQKYPNCSSHFSLQDCALQDFAFIEEEIYEDLIKSKPKNIYRKYVTEKVTQAAFNNFITSRENKPKKTIQSLEYSKLLMQNILH